MPARVSTSRSTSSRNVARSYQVSAPTVSSSAARLVSMNPVINLLRIERSRKRAMLDVGASLCEVRSVDLLKPPEPHQHRHQCLCHIDPAIQINVAIDESQCG